MAAQGLEALLLLGLFGALCWEAQPRVSPDGLFYMKQPRKRPYCMRGLLPAVLQDHYLAAWQWVSWTAVGLTALLLWVLHGAGVAALWLGLASTRTNLWLPALTDQLGICLLVVLVEVVEPLMGLPALVGLTLLASLVNEKIPVFVALAVWSPWPLIGLGLSGLLYYVGHPPEDHDPKWLRDPWPALREALQQTSWQGWVLPWGVALVGLPLVSPWLVLGAYLQCFLGLDRARLYQWAGPMVCIAAGEAIQLHLAPYWSLLLLVHLTNPWRTQV